MRVQIIHSARRRDEGGDMDRVGIWESRYGSEEVGL